MQITPCTTAVVVLLLAATLPVRAAPEDVPTFVVPAAVAPAETLPPPRPVPESILTLEQLLALAARYSPDLPAARAQVDAARGKLIQAGLYPNPTVSWNADVVGDRSNAAGEQSLVVNQNLVTAGKLRLAREAAAHGVTAAQWQAVTRWYDLVTRVRTAYWELLAAEQEVRANEEIVRLAEAELDAAQRLQKAGAGTEPDVLRARVELEQSRMRREVSRQRREAAGKLLAVAVGVRELPPGPLAGALETPAPEYEWGPVLAVVLQRSSEVQAAQALVLQAERQVWHARAEVTPDVQVMLQPKYSFPEQNAEGQIQVGATLPLFDRNQGNILTAEADLARTVQEARQVELRLTERLATAFQRYQNGRQQAEAYAQRILPNARESLRLVRIGYERGDPKYDYTTVLQAQHTLAQARLAYVQALGEQWRAASEIMGLLQVDDGPLPCPH